MARFCFRSACHLNSVTCLLNKAKQTRIGAFFLKLRTQNAQSLHKIQKKITSVGKPKTKSHTDNLHNVTTHIIITHTINNQSIQSKYCTQQIKQHGISSFFILFSCGSCRLLYRPSFYYCRRRHCSIR